MASFQIDAIQAPTVTDPAELKEPTVVIEAADDSTLSSSDGSNASPSEWVYPHPTDFKISDHHIDRVRTLRVWTITASDMNKVTELVFRWP